MLTLLRDSTFGQLVRWVSKGRLYQYPEEKADFHLPESYRNVEKLPSAERTRANSTAEPLAEKLEEEAVREGHRSSTPDTLADNTIPGSTALNSPNTASHTDVSKTNPEKDLEQAPTQEDSLERQVSKPIVPAKTEDGVILVDWYTTDDPENPKNWTSRKKTIVVLQLYLYTLAVYMGSAIYTPSEPDVMRVFGVSSTVAQLGLALYVLGYGTGPLIFSPMSEVPIIGRNPPYIVTFGIFVILCVPTALVNNIGGLLVLRFLQGFFGSPCLATGGASLGDVTSLIKLSYFICGWAGFATAGPALGPLISGFSVPAENWRWSLWEMLWLAGPIFIAMFFLLPETSASNILLRRAQRIRKLTGDSKYKSQSEIDQAKMTTKSIAFETLVRPWQINILDPAVLFTSVYTAIVYGIYYSFFEVFPIVYEQGYGLNVGEMGLVFLSIAIAVAVAIPTYMIYLKYVFEPSVKTQGFANPERLLVPALYASILPPVGLFMFGWTGRPSIHWIVPTIGIFFYVVGVFILIQSIFIYVPLIYPQYAASLFAGNDFSRSAFAFGAILYADPLFKTLGVGPGCSLLGGLTIGCVGGIWALWYWGAKLRARSKFAAKY